MKANELRIGNWVQNPVQEQKIIGIFNLENPSALMFDIVREAPKMKHPLEMCNPIPLTEEWLKRFGFEDDDNDWLINIDDRTSIHINLKKKRYLLESYDGIIKISHPSEYVHQLQNLYFVLTAKEIETTY